MLIIQLLEMMPCIETLYVQYIGDNAPHDDLLRIHGWAKVAITNKDDDEYAETMKIVPMVIEPNGNCLSIVMIQSFIDYRVLTSHAMAQALVDKYKKPI